MNNEKDAERPLRIRSRPCRLHASRFRRTGCAFADEISLPRHTAKTGEMREESPAAPVAMGHEAILLVEDDPLMLDMTRLMLETFGYRVLAASTPGAG
jgi:hypothetical protein